MKECRRCSSKEDTAGALGEGETKTIARMIGREIARTSNGVLERFPDEPLRHDDDQDGKVHEDPGE